MFSMNISSAFLAWYVFRCGISKGSSIIHGGGGGGGGVSGISYIVIIG